MIRKATKQLALCGVLAGLCTVLMCLGGMLPGATYCAPLLASLVLLPAREEYGAKPAWLLFAASALLSLMLSADKEAAVLFLALGWYPLVKASLDALRPRVLSRLCKLAIFNAAVAAAYALLLFVLVLDALRAELGAMGTALLLALLLGGNLVFLIYDRLLARLVPLYRRRLQPTLRKALK